MRGIWWQGRGERLARSAVAAVVLIGTAGSAWAGNGDGNFFQQIFGGGGQEQPAQPQYDQPGPDEAPVFAPRYERRASRPLTVRLHRPKAMVAQVPSKPLEKVTIFTDRTLRRGDAVMTANGMRIFAGSRSWPYTESDFVSIADAGRLDKDMRKTLLAFDSLPRQ